MRKETFIKAKKVKLLCFSGCKVCVRLCKIPLNEGKNWGTSNFKS